MYLKPFLKWFETFSPISVHPGHKYETFFNLTFSDFSRPPHPRFNDGLETYKRTKTEPPVSFLHHWTGGAGCMKFDEKSLIFMSTTDKCVGHKSPIFCKFMCKYRIWKFQNRCFGFGILGTTLTRRPPLAVVCRGHPATHRHEGGPPAPYRRAGGPHEMSSSCSSKTRVNAMFFRAKWLPPGDLLLRQSTQSTKTTKRRFLARVKR